MSAVSIDEARRRRGGPYPGPTGALATLLVLGAVGCASQPSPVGELRFYNRPPVWVVNDRTDVAQVPAETPFYPTIYHFDGYWHKRIDRRLALPTPTRATNTNALDEVPDSTWFTNRIGRDVISSDSGGGPALTPADIARGPNVTGSPEDHRPWRILSSKTGGSTPGFIIEDARGIKYLLKFDSKGFPEMETAADVIVQRLLWAFGYNVPEDYIVHFHREDLVRDARSVIKQRIGDDEPMTDAYIDSELKKVIVGKGGTIRGLVSQYLPGKPLGGHGRTGVREDDPNDRVPHEQRRELRGQYAVFSWLDQTDAKEDNSLDVYVEDPGNSEIQYVVHYLLDFGKGLGTQPFINSRRFVGTAYFFDGSDIGTSLITLGLWQRPWEDRTETGLRGVGLLESEMFDPGSWHPYSPSYFPFLDADRFDNFWAAKTLIRFTPAHIRAAVAQGELSDPRAAAYITRQLIARQRKVARYWFARTAPLDRFEVSAAGATWTLCFDDLSLVHKLERDPSQSHYYARAFDYDGKPLNWRLAGPAASRGRTCLGEIPPATSREGYTIVEVIVTRGGKRLPPVLVHLARDPSGTPSIIGLRRK